MTSELLAAIRINLQFEHFKTPQVIRCLDASLRAYYLQHSRHATLFSDGISKIEKELEIKREI